MTNRTRRKAVHIAALLGGVATIIASTGSDVDEFVETVTTTLESVGTILAAAWRTEGNAILYLNSDQRQQVALTIDMSEQPYPPNNNDASFLNQDDIVEAMESTNLEQFILQCGKEGEDNLTTQIVFWSSANWEGSSEIFNCGGAGSYEVSNTLGSSSAASLCVVSRLTPSNRYARCLNGPQCDDAMNNGTETDVDCGGECNGCGVDQLCAQDSDCDSNSCNAGRCRQPSCSDGRMNGSETDIDCGGSCNRCNIGQMCTQGRDCESGNCSGGTCQARPTCNGTPATSSARNFDVLVEDFLSCGGVQRRFANSESEAIECAQNDGWQTVDQLCGFYLSIAGDNFIPYVIGTSSSAAVQCARNTICSTCSFSAGTPQNCVSQ